MPAVKSNRPVNLSMGQVLAKTLKSPVAIASILHRLSGVIVFLLVAVLLWILINLYLHQKDLTTLKKSFSEIHCAFYRMGICSWVNFLTFIGLSTYLLTWFCRRITKRSHAQLLFH